jgi:excisionase family DNA binding protein
MAGRLMSEIEPDAAGDPWLTVAEIAAELRLNPATIRLWISKGTLPATRAGRRKLLIRRSDLDRLLQDMRSEHPAGDPLPRLEGGYENRRSPPLSRRQLSTADVHSQRPTPGETEEIIRRIQLADEAWEQARAASDSPPPDAGFPYRLRALADACEQQGTWLLSAAQTLGFQWTPVSDRRDMVVSYELRPGANRPGPPPLWVEFDRRVQRLGIAMAGGWMYHVAWAYRDLAEVMRGISDALLADDPSEEDPR